MNTDLFSSIFTTSNTNLTVSQGALTMGTSLILGILLAAVYKYRTQYSKEFVMTLALLPTLVSMIIFLVSGNLGTSVAVAGTFSLIKFRSANGTSKELLSVFIATAIGLATGTGYLMLASVFTLVVLTMILIFENTKFIQINENRRHILLTVPLQFEYENFFPNHFGKACKSASLESIKYKKNKEALILEYIVEFDSSIKDKLLMDTILATHPIDLVLNKQAPKKKRL
ncbi:DUF4956 domain-containing protein [Streptococcus caprae]|uniref:DUF4956 domain-containing protein n=1 Tax=Streptococcus caprae TaxID=1640501 RepID=A0ABV8CY38_9STRE